jgi:signal recognition particle GTPase
MSDTIQPVAAPEVAQAEAKPEATVQQAPAAEAKPFKVFTSEEEFNRTLQSERSKAKHEVLKELNANSVDAVKENLTAYEVVQKTAEELKAKTSKLEEQLLVTQMGIVPELVEEALTLAKAKPGKPLNEALAEVITKFPSMVGKVAVKPEVKVGTEANPQVNDAATSAKSITAKYPWIKL